MNGPAIPAGAPAKKTPTSGTQDLCFIEHESGWNASGLFPQASYPLPKNLPSVDMTVA